MSISCVRVYYSICAPCSSALASPQFEGRGGEELGHHLAHQLSQAYCHHSAIERESLCIISGQQCWVLYVDVLVSELVVEYFDTIVGTIAWYPVPCFDSASFDSA